jgi:tetratricopeptide (TPR) repeat protein
VLALCRGIREKKLEFLWSCDTRVDVLNEELLYEMRLAGCQRLSLGVESGSQRILDLINKKITVDEIIESTALAKKYGIQVRYYMMLGNRGETLDTFRETLQFLKSAKPHQYIFSCLSIFPGTQDFHDAEAAGWLDREVYFTGDFQELKTPYDAGEQVTQAMSDWFAGNSGLRDFYREGIDECRAILERMPEHAPAHLDLAGACYRDGQLDPAARHAERALELGYPLPGLALNYLACIAAGRGELEKMMDLFMKAAKTDPQHYVLIKNVEAARKWFKAQGPANHLPLDLVASHEFQLLERTAQPSLPGPLPEDFADWNTSPAHLAQGELLPDATSRERRSTLHFGKRLRVVE